LEPDQRPKIANRDKLRQGISAENFLPPKLSVGALRVAAEHCRGCQLYKRATQVVFGEGLVRSRLMLVGEIAGDGEDRAGKPFVGPAGRILDEALAEAGIDRREAYVTNVVKHFKWIPKGKRRLHQKPNAEEIRACLPWLEAEIAVVRPEVIVCLGATAARTLVGPSFRVSRQHGEFVESALADHLTATIHPSAILRSPTEAERRAAMRRFVADLEKVARVLGNASR
jgi:uracil-DNA glycosylase family protein